MQDVAIIGSGPAGLSASLYTVRAGLSTAVYVGETRGGLPTTTEQVDNYLGLPGIDGVEMAEVFLNHAKNLGVSLYNDTVETIFAKADGTFSVILTNGNSYDFRTVIFAAGSKPRKLGIPGEDLPGVSWCSVCDGSFSKGEDTAVVGGGESAVEEAIYMSNIANKVTVLVRSDSFRATQPAVELLLSKPNVEVLYNVAVEEVLGDGGVEALHLSSGARLPVYSLFEAIGQIPQSHLASPHSALYDNGFISHSSVPGFFVAGDISNPEYRQIAVAVGDGAKAGMDAIKFIQNAG